MNYKTLGNSGVKVSELILGCWAMGGDYFGETEDKSSLEAIRTSFELGVNTLDTAEIYGKGRSERVVGQAIQELGRDRLCVISKVFKPSMAHDKMMKACEDSLSRLGTEYLDVYFLHYPIPNEEVSIEERMSTMMELKRSGKIRAIGLSNFSLEEMKEAITAVATATVTFAVRETTIGDKEIHEGDILGMLNDSIAVVGKDIAESTKELLAEAVTDESEMISIYYGADVTEEDAEALAAYVEETYPDCEVELQMGGQPLYYYIISVE